MQRGSKCAFLCWALWHGSFHLPLELPPVCFARPTRSTRCARSILLLPLDLPSHVLAVLGALHVMQSSWEEWPQQYGYQYEPRYEYEPRYKYQPMKTDPETMPSSYGSLPYGSEPYKYQPPAYPPPPTYPPPHPTLTPPPPPLPPQAPLPRVRFAASRLASGGGLHVSRVFRVPQHPIKTEPEEESTPPADPPQEPKAAEKESAGAAKSDAEMGEQPPEEAAAAGEEMEKDAIVHI